MSFNVLTVRSGLDAADDALYPALSDVSVPEVIALDRRDGQQVTRVVATTVRVLEARTGGLKQLVTFGKSRSMCSSRTAGSR